MSTSQPNRRAFVSPFGLVACSISAIALLTAAGCNRADSTSSQSDAAAATNRAVLRIGYQKSSALLNLLRKRNVLERRFGDQVEVVWQEFAAGPQMLEALNVGSVDFGTSGEAPPIFAQAAGAPLLYVALEQVGPASEAILVPINSTHKSIADLKGKRIALNKGSNVHYFLVRALEAAGLKFSDVEPVYLSPADARAAFDGGRVDAWAIWDPFLAAALGTGQARVLLNGTGLVQNYQFYLATRDLVAQQPQVVQGVLAELRSMSDWAASHRDEVSDFLTALLELDPEVLRVAERRRLYGIETVGPETVAYQQRIADTFFQLGLIPNSIQVADVIWTAPASDPLP